MTLDEFKAWFAGYTDHIGPNPNSLQWDRIKKQIASTYNPVKIERELHAPIRNDNVGHIL